MEKESNLTVGDLIRFLGEFPIGLTLHNGTLFKSVGVSEKDMVEMTLRFQIPKNKKDC